MDQITITRKDFRYMASKLVAERMKRADEEDQDMSALERIVMIMMQASLCADLEKKLFGEGSKED